MIYAEDIRVGAVYELGTYTISEHEMIEFANSWDPQSFHISPEGAQKSPFGELIASGVHTLAICNRLSVDAVFDKWAIIAGRRLTEIEFRRPVLAGELTGTLKVLTIDISPERCRGLVATAATISSAENLEVLFQMTAHSYVRTRPADDFETKSH